MHFYAYPHTLQSALENGQEARIVYIDFSAAFDRVNHQGNLYELCSVWIWGSVLSILTQFLLNHLQHVMVDGCGSKLINVVSVMETDFPIQRYFQEWKPINVVSVSTLKNKLIGYADYSSLIGGVSSRALELQ